MGWPLASVLIVLIIGVTVVARALIFKAMELELATLEDDN